jgi:hypothetical protein
MQYSQRVLFSDDTLLHDELDDLFGRLEQLEPPPSLIAHILESISRFPQPREPVQHDPWDDLDSLVVRREKDPPC